MIRENSYFGEFLKTIESNTDKHLHTENAMLIAVNFGDEIQKEEMREILKDHNDIGHIKPITSIARAYLVKYILSNIKNKRLANQISRRL